MRPIFQGSRLTFRSALTCFRSAFARSPTARRALWILLCFLRGRGDYAGRVLTIRDGDLRALATLYAITPSQFIEMLQQWATLDDSSNLPDTSDRT